MRTWLFGFALGVVLAFVSVEISLIVMGLAVAAVIVIGMALPPRYAFLSGGLVGIGGLWLVGTLSSLPCEGSAAACGDPYPMIGVTATLVLVGLVAGLVTARERFRLAR